MNPAKLALALSSATALACVGLPPPLPPNSDPANPHAPEGPAIARSTVLASDPPPTASLNAPAAEGGMQMDHGSMQHENHGDMQPKKDGGMRPKADAGMQHDHGQMHHAPAGSRDAGATTPEQHHQHQGVQPAAPMEARDGGSP